MISRSAKSFYYSIARIPMWVNAKLYRTFRQSSAPLMVHLGCGQKNYILGWLNVDANIVTARRDLWANLLDGLPFRDDSVERFYSFHVIEHLPDERLKEHFQEMYRALTPGGVIRVGGPSLDNACRKFVENDRAWFYDFPDSRASVGGRFVNFIFCRGEHLTALSESYLREIAEAVGFRDVRFCLPVLQSEYGFESVLPFESESHPECAHSIILEARKS